MKKAKGIDIMTILGVAAGVAVGVWALNRFSADGVLNFGKPMQGPAQQR